MAETTARRVADAILSLSREQGREITNLKLQKLIYYAQAWFLALKDRKLFDEDLEAWVHGPVVARVFGDFKHYRWSPIIDVGITSNVSNDVLEHLGDVLFAYGDLSATQLERLTHAEEPWRDARGNLPSDEPSRNVIKTELMKSFYSSMLANA
jgi:uncharacterized phage-associated protein